MTGQRGRESGPVALPGRLENGHANPETIPVARLPLDGGPPTLVDRYTGSSATYIVR